MKLTTVIGLGAMALGAMACTSREARSPNESNYTTDESNAGTANGNFRQNTTAPNQGQYPSENMTPSTGESGKDIHAGLDNAQGQNWQGQTGQGPQTGQGAQNGQPNAGLENGQSGQGIQNGQTGQGFQNGQPGKGNDNLQNGQADKTVPAAGSQERAQIDKDFTDRLETIDARVKNVNAKLAKANADTRKQAADLLKNVTTARAKVVKDRQQFAKVGNDQYQSMRTQIDSALTGIENQLDQLESLVK